MIVVRRALALLLALALVVGAGACSSGGDGGAGDGDTSAASASDAPHAPSAALPELSAVRAARSGDRAVFVDASGRELLLRGANLSSLGDYYQADPERAPTRPPTDADWDGMAANGFSVVRLIVSWSRLEPERGQLDDAYVEEIRSAIASAATRRIYTVVDMHQDAWGKAIATPPGTDCPEGHEPAIGWDGAPDWATITDEESTCRPEGFREGAPAVHAAFRAFYEDRDGIRDAFTTTWRRLVAALGDTPAIAGYDLFNEPNIVYEAEEMEARYTELLQATIGAVRAGEVEAGVEPRVIFVEPVIGHPLPGTMPSVDFADDDQLAFAPHSYAEVIGPPILTVEQTFDVQIATATERGWPLWIGEHGAFSLDDGALDVLSRFAAKQDEAIVGGAQWQWRQWCGDPHSVGVPRGEATQMQVQLNNVDCPSDVDLGPNLSFLQVAGRSYPRAAPGRLTALRSDHATRRLSLEGMIDDDLGSASDLIVWVRGSTMPQVEGDGLGEVEITSVVGGWYVAAEVVDTPYSMDVE